MGWDCTTAKLQLHVFPGYVFRIEALKKTNCTHATSRTPKLSQFICTLGGSPGISNITPLGKYWVLVYFQPMSQIIVDAPNWKCLNADIIWI